MSEHLTRKFKFGAMVELYGKKVHSEKDEHSHGLTSRAAREAENMPLQEPGPGKEDCGEAK